MTIAEQLRAHLDESPAGVMWRLPGVGWMAVKVMVPYPPGSGTSKRVLFFTGGPLKDELNGLQPRDLRTLEKTSFPDDPPERFADLPFAIDELTAAIRSALLAGGELAVKQIGTFRIVEKPARPGFNPDTGEPIVVEARKIVQFRARRDTP